MMIGKEKKLFMNSKRETSVPGVQHKSGVISGTWAGPNQGNTAQKLSLEEELASFTYISTYFFTRCFLATVIPDAFPLFNKIFNINFSVLFLSPSSLNSKCYDHWK